MSDNAIECAHCTVVLTASERPNYVCSDCQARFGIPYRYDSGLLSVAVGAWSFWGLIGGAACGIWLQNRPFSPIALLLPAVLALLGALLCGVIAYFGGKRYRWIVRAGCWLFILNEPT